MNSKTGFATVGNQIARNCIDYNCSDDGINKSCSRIILGETVYRKCLILDGKICKNYKEGLG